MAAVAILEVTARVTGMLLGPFEVPSFLYGSISIGMDVGEFC